MTPQHLGALVDQYLSARRGLGFDLDTPRWYLNGRSRHGLAIQHKPRGVSRRFARWRSFARFADRGGHHGPITTDLAVQGALLCGL